MLYRVRVGEDEYLGTAEEVVAFMARAEGSPSRDPRGYMEGVAKRLRERMGVEGLPTDDPAAFLDALAERKILRVERRRPPLEDRVDPQRALDEGPVTLGEGVDPEDLPL